MCDSLLLFLVLVLLWASLFLSFCLFFLCLGFFYLASAPLARATSPPSSFTLARPCSRGQSSFGPVVEGEVEDKVSQFELAIVLRAIAVKSVAAEVAVVLRL